MTAAEFQRGGSALLREVRDSNSGASGEEFGPIDRLLNVKEAAQFLGMAPGTLYHMVSERRVPFVRISNRCLRFSKAALEHFVKEKSVPAV